ncbi:DUF4292 domain-containing protein, partial [Candidatus Poribacteria bacterium]|nr:DUF4292 domain-containing protein [Candidatus Poribacteria bacterium]
MRILHKNGVLRTLCFFLCLLIVIVHNGCATNGNIIIESPVSLSEVSPHLETLQARYDLTDTLRTDKMRVIIQEGDNEAEELRERLWYKKSIDGSDLLRIQVLGAFNDPKGIAIANRDEFLLAFIEQQETYKGKLSDGILREIFGIDLRVSDVLSAIFANPFLDGRTKDLKVTRSGKKYIVMRPSVESGSTEYIILHIQDDEPRVIQWSIKDKDDTLLQSAFFSDYREVDGILRPHKVHIERPIEQTRVTVSIAQVQINTEIKQSRFDFSPFLTDDFIIKSFSDIHQP